MSVNPYSVLGVSPGTDIEEIKKQYRALVKKYHPDLHPNDPDAAAKMSEINAAYEKIKEDIANGGVLYGGNYSRMPFSDAEGDDFLGSFYTTFDFGTAASRMSEDEIFEKVHRYIEEGHLGSASSLLNRIVVRNGRWYYYAACVSEASGDAATAVRYADIAIKFDPTDPDFANMSVSCHKKYDSKIRWRKACSAFLTVTTLTLAGIFILRLGLMLFGYVMFE